MPDTEVCRRRVIVNHGKKSQTVNVCNEHGRSGVDDWIVVFPRTALVIEAIRLNAAARRTIPEFVTWLARDRSTPGINRREQPQRFRPPSN
mgnify:CR=1 FL=1